MKGTLHKTESGWQVWYHAKEDLFYGNTGVRILPLHPDAYSVNGPMKDVVTSWEGQEVEFEIVEFPAPPTNGPVSNNINRYAVLVDKTIRPLTEDDAWPEYPTRADQLRKQTWQQIMEESGSWDALEILNYIIKNYNPPTKK